MSKAFFFSGLFTLLIPFLMSCQKVSSLEAAPAHLSSFVDTRSGLDDTRTDKSTKFDISETLVRHYLEESEVSANVQSIEPYSFEDGISFYVVNLDKGWRIISSDARTNAVLAKGESGQFDISANNNPNVRFWLNDIAKQVNLVKHSSIEKVDDSWRQMEQFKRSSRIPLDSLHRSLPNNPDSVWVVIRHQSDTTIQYFYDVPHLLTTKWGQDEPWNMALAPFSSTNMHYITGCVPTAIAQILYYFHHFQGQPSGLYHSISIQSMNPYNEWIYDPNTQTFVWAQTGDTSSISRQSYCDNSPLWDAMPLDSVAAVSNSVGAGYVSDLMIDLGNRLTAIYRNSLTDVYSMSNTLEIDLSRCNLDYDWSLYNEAIRDSVVSNLTNARPVIVTGSNYQGGHAWIIDGGYHKKTTIQETFTYHHIPRSELGEAMHPSLGVFVDWFISLQDLHWFYPNAPKSFDRITTTWPERYFRMNWGYDGHYDDGVYSCDVGGDWGFNTDKAIYYNLIPSASFEY